MSKPDPCRRFERAWLSSDRAGDVSERGEEEMPDLSDLLDPAHMATCLSCQAARADYLALHRGLADLGRGMSGQTDWEARVWSQVARRRPPIWRRLAVVVAPIAVMAAVLLLVRAHVGFNLSSSISHENDMHESEHARAQGLVSPRALPRGGTLAVDAHIGQAAHVDVRVYSDVHGMIARCDDPQPCERVRDIVSVRLPIERPGVYRAVVFTSRSPIPPAQGDYQRDLAAARERGAEVRVVDIVHIE